MRNSSNAALAASSNPNKPTRNIFFLVAFLITTFLPSIANSQAVTSIITDYNGWFKTSSVTPNTTKPANHHNLLAFGYNGVQYSTGANDYLLNSKGETFSAQDFWSLPVEGFTGAINGNTKAGMGQMADGVHNGPSVVPPVNDVAHYLTDGIKGLNLGTCIANLPSGAMTFHVYNINPAAIGDGVPDILVTQIADPSGSSDRYEFTDINGVRIGNYKDIVFTNITPVGTWTADFYEASKNPMTLAGGYTNTDRPIRLWAADLSEFGITAANYQDIRKFKINLSGNSDVAFAAYNNLSIQITNPLAVKLTTFDGDLKNKQVELRWITQTETDNESFTIERGTDERNFNAIGTIEGAGNSSTMKRYTFIDANPVLGNNYYRLKMTSSEGDVTYSTVILIKNQEGVIISVFPNPASGDVNVQHPQSRGNEEIRMVNASGVTVAKKNPSANSTRTKIDFGKITPGIYYITYYGGNEPSSFAVLVK
jgi:hypothetical protein